ncbi:MAG: methionine gamma-lyase family protein [Clostridia bacterium]|nr:methionine gamma-lyase family protein [Clostridia bacterium]
MQDSLELWGISPQIEAMANAVEEEIKPVFAEIDKVEKHCQKKVLSAFCKNKVSAAHFAATSGYGYDDLGRDTLDCIFADSFGCEAALVRPQFVSGTHTLAVMLFAVLRPGDTLLSVTGAPYDTLFNVIAGEGGSLREFGVGYEEVALADGKPDWAAIEKALQNKDVKAVFMTRSKGYAWRDSLLTEDMAALSEKIRKIRQDVLILVDNCYGEFVEKEEPHFADLFAGSLIKNAGGGLAPCGGYIAGKKELVKLAADRLTAPGIGLECGANLGVMKDLYLGFFMAPHVVAQAVRCAVFAGALMQKLGFEVCPRPADRRSDIIQAIKLGSGERVIAFCGGLQAASPVDSFVAPVPWDMPGYHDQIIMAAGAFTQGSSIEMSADGPIRPPYIAYLQGGLTYESGKLAILAAASKVMQIQ